MCHPYQHMTWLLPNGLKKQSCWAYGSQDTNMTKQIGNRSQYIRKLKASKPSPYVKVLLNLKLCSIRKACLLHLRVGFLYHQASIFSNRLSYLLLWSMTHPLFHRPEAERTRNSRSNWLLQRPGVTNFLGRAVDVSCRQVHLELRSSLRARFTHRETGQYEKWRNMATLEDVLDFCKFCFCPTFLLL